MCKLSIHNLGPVADVEIDVRKVIMVIGPQSSGKSTIGKTLCHCQWVEKRCFTSPEREMEEQAANFREGMETYHRLDGYFRSDTRIHYDGSFVTIDYCGGECSIKPSAAGMVYAYPKLSYIPAERNFAAVIPNVKKYNETNDLILYFIYDWTTAREYVKSASLGSILQREITYTYSKRDDTDAIQDGDARLKLRNSSSGVQSLLPLYVVAMYSLVHVYKRIKPVSPEQMRQMDALERDLKKVKAIMESLKEDAPDTESGRREMAVRMMAGITANPMFQIVNDDAEGLRESMRRKYFYKGTSLFLEEPEQNLFPEAQEKLLYWLMEMLVGSEHSNTAYITTHSPYMLFALNNCMLGGLVGERMPKEELKDLLSTRAWTDPAEVAIYEMRDGGLVTVQDEDGLLRENYLDQAYRRNSAEFMAMLQYL